MAGMLPKMAAPEVAVTSLAAAFLSRNRHRTPWYRRIPPQVRKALLRAAALAGFPPDLAWRFLCGNRLTARIRISLGYAGVCFKWAPPRRFRGAPEVTLHVGKTPHGNGLFLDQKSVPAGTLVATATGRLVDLSKKPDKNEPIYYWERGRGDAPGTIKYFKLDSPSIDHPGNLVNTVMPEDGETFNVRVHFSKENPGLAQLIATREITKGDQIVADYAGDRAFRSRMKAEPKKAEAVVRSEWLATFAAEGRNEKGKFTAANALRRACPFCNRAPVRFNRDSTRQAHIRECALKQHREEHGVRKGGRRQPR